MKKRIIAFLLVLITIILMFVGCSSSNNEETETTTEVTTEQNKIIIPDDNSTFKLSYTQSDSLDPFKATTQNNQLLMQLVFESLFDVDDSYKATLNIASTYEYTNDKTLKITISDGLKFSDGSSIDSSDIAYSFKAAKKSDYWGFALDGISSCYEEDSTTVVFKLAYPNKYAHNLLIFPIASVNDKDGFPVGSGRYYFAKDTTGSIVLYANEKRDFKPHLTAIHLENIVSRDSIDNAINIGNISFAYRDLSEDSDKRITANKKLVNTNNLVFIGVNNKTGITANAYIRKAISLAIDRETLVKSAYNGFAYAANGVFNPKFELSQSNLFESNADANAAKQAISQSGVGGRTLKLLTNNDTERKACAILIKQQLESVGFLVDIKVAKNDAEYRQLIGSESFSLYIGEIKLPADMSLHSFFYSDGRAKYGIDVNKSKASISYHNYVNGKEELGTFLLDFSTEMPYIPILYKNSMICFTKTMNGDRQGNWFDCFSNIENWYFISKIDNSSTTIVTE